MDFSLTEEHIMIRDAARDFAQAELLPGVIERDNKQEFPKELVKKMGDLGFMGIMVDPKYGGSGMDAISYVLIMEELSKIDIDFHPTQKQYSVHTLALAQLQHRV